MNDPKYLKNVSLYADCLYDHYDNAYTLEEYETLVKQHLTRIKQDIEEFKKTHKDADEIKVVVRLEADLNHEDYAARLDYETRITGRVPMNEKEREAADQGERNRQANTERYERQQLEALLKKYPRKDT